MAKDALLSGGVCRRILNLASAFERRVMSRDTRVRGDTCVCSADATHGDQGEVLRAANVLAGVGMSGGCGFNGSLESGPALKGSIG
jgi:hypothetical protein